MPPEKAPERARLAVVGEQPGRNELEQGRPFIGASGRMLERGLRTIGLRRSDCHWTNAVPCDCHPRDLPKARKACAKRLREELAATGASVVMPVGKLALHSTLDLRRKPEILKWRGSVSPAPWKSYAETPATADSAARRSPETSSGVSSRGPVESSVSADASAAPGSAGRGAVWVLPTVHPAFVMRAPKWGPVLEIDVARVGRVLANGFAAPEEDTRRRLLIPKTLDALRSALAALAPGADVAFDVETVGLGPTRTALVCFGISDGTTTIVVPWSREANGLERFWGFPARALALVNAALASRVVVTHNGPAFDHIVARRYGISIRAWEDTLLAAHATEGHMPKNLAHVVTRGLDVPPWKQLEDRGVDIERLWVYNGRDCLYTILRWLQMKGIASAA